MALLSSDFCGVTAAVFGIGSQGVASKSLTVFILCGAANIRIGTQGVASMSLTVFILVATTTTTTTATIFYFAAEARQGLHIAANQFS